MSSVLKVDAIQNTAGTSGLTINSNGFVIPKAVAFSVYKSANQTMTSATWTEVTWDTEEFDTASFFNTSNSRFEPQIAGYYQINFSVNQSTGVGNAVLARLMKNGSVHRFGAYHYHSASEIDDYQMWASMMVYMNGSTDYLTVDAYGIGLTTVNGGSTQSVFQGFLVGV